MTLKQYLVGSNEKVTERVSAGKPYGESRCAGGMDMHSREQYLEQRCERSIGARSKKQKTRLLNEARKRTRLAARC